MFVELCLEFLGGFLEFHQTPQQISRAEVHIRLSRISLNRGAKLLHCAGIVFHLVQRLTRQHVGFSRLRIQRKDLVIIIKNALVLF